MCINDRGRLQGPKRHKASSDFGGVAPGRTGSHGRVALYCQLPAAHARHQSRLLRLQNRFVSEYVRSPKHDRTVKMNGGS